MNRPASLQRPQEVLGSQLAELLPARLLCVGESRLPVVEAYRAAHPEHLVRHCHAGPLPEVAAQERYDLALFSDCLEHLAKPDAEQLVGGVRNLNASRISVLVDLNACDWSENDFYALAMQRVARFQRPGQELTLFGYDLLNYKQVPNWLNARFWAHPENFGKYWW